MDTLWQRYRMLQAKQADLRDRTRVISRQIGTAKRNGGPTEALLASMQAESAALKTIERELAERKARLLMLLGSESDAGARSEDPAQLPDKRVYRLRDGEPTGITIERLGTDIGDWNAYATGNRAASLYHRAEWRDLVRETFGHDCHYLLARDASRAVVGILPLVHLRSRLFGNFMVSMPYFNYGGAVADHPSVELQLMQAAASYAEGQGISHIEFRDDIPRADMPVRDAKVSMRLPLPPDEQSLWDGFSPKLRAQIRRPQREHTDTKHGGMDLLDDFYRVFARNMRDLGTPVYSKTFFRNILRLFPEQSDIVVVYLDNRPVAAAFLLGHRDTLEIPWASSLKHVNHLSMNMLLYWTVLRLAVERGYRSFDFGRSSRDAGTFRFKQQWGALPRQLYWHYWLNGNGSLPGLNPDNPKYALAINLWKRLPISVSIWLGPPIVKNLP
jgi:FemAB-related protein (PEP-CTERM system-associated)